MRIATMSDADIQRLVGTALDAGITVFDHADVYGGARHRCEERFGKAVHLSPEQRARITIQSKVGIRPGFFDFSTEHIRASRRVPVALKTEYLDVLLLHRPDTLVEPEKSPPPSMRSRQRERFGSLVFPTSRQARSNCSRRPSSSRCYSTRCNSASPTRT